MLRWWCRVSGRRGRGRPLRAPRAGASGAAPGG